MPAKGTSRFIVTPRILARVEALARKGLSMEQIARVLGVTDRTIYTHKKINAQFAQAIKNGQAKGVANVSNALYKAAMKGNITAQIFFLKNRDIDAWKDRQYIDETRRNVKQPSQIDSKMSAHQAASTYADTLKTGTGGTVVPLKRKKR